jgi:hypothetical protein
MEHARFRCARSESLRRTFLDRVSRQRLALEVSSDPVRAGASKNQGAFRLKLRLKPLS